MVITTRPVLELKQIGGEIQRPTKSFLMVHAIVDIQMDFMRSQNNLNGLIILSLSSQQYFQQLPDCSKGI